MEKTELKIELRKEVSKLLNREETISFLATLQLSNIQKEMLDYLKEQPRTEEEMLLKRSELILQKRKNKQ